MSVSTRRAVLKSCFSPGRVRDGLARLHGGGLVVARASMDVHVELRGASRCRGPFHFRHGARPFFPMFSSISSHIQAHPT